MQTKSPRYPYRRETPPHGRAPDVHDILQLSLGVLAALAVMVLSFALTG